MSNTSALRETPHEHHARVTHSKSKRGSACALTHTPGKRCRTISIAIWSATADFPSSNHAASLRGKGNKNSSINVLQPECKNISSAAKSSRGTLPIILRLPHNYYQFTICGQHPVLVRALTATPQQRAPPALQRGYLQPSRPARKPVCPRGRFRPARPVQGG